MSVHRVPNDQIADADLLVDAVYEGGRHKNAADDPLPALMRVSNQGGFRYRGKLSDRLELLCLVSNSQDANWPDTLDPLSGVFTYFGDNKLPGSPLTGTKRFGNKILENLFASAAGSALDRERIPPIFVFERTDSWRDVRFLGMAVPGTAECARGEDLVAIWRAREGLRFQNYRAKFTILDAPRIRRSWIESLISGQPDRDTEPSAWKQWREFGARLPLRATPTVEFRSPAEQTPTDEADITLLRTLTAHFQADPYAFEKCACELIRLHLPNVSSLSVTRAYQDGGRDGIGTYLIGDGPGSIAVDFALEAKCYTPPNSVGTRDVSRLISRLRHRQFGILVTTSWVARQAYKEIKEDNHPIVVVAGSDIVAILKRSGIATPADLNVWLDATRASSQMD